MGFPKLNNILGEDRIISVLAPAIGNSSHFKSPVQVFSDVGKLRMYILVAHLLKSIITVGHFKSMQLS